MTLVCRIGVVLASVLLAACSSAVAPTAAPNSTSQAPDASAVPSPVSSAFAPSAPLPSETASSPAVAPSAAPTPTPIPISETAWGKELDNVAPDGTRSLESALRLFAIAFGPIPGVDVHQDLTGIRSATIAVWELRAHDAELTPEQRAAIEERLQPPPDALTTTIPPITDGRVPVTVELALAAAPAELWKVIETEAVKYRATLAGKLGGDIPGAIKVFFEPTTHDYGLTDAEENGPGGTYSGCRIRITAKGTSEPVVALNTLVHEMFHCFEAARYGTAARWTTAPRWVIEGGAEWVAADVVGTDYADQNFWLNWLSFPSVTLPTRAYSAIGFWFHLQETGIDPWSVFPAIFKVDGHEASYLTSGAENDRTLDSWASGLARDPGRGPGWDTTGIGITTDRTDPYPVSVANGESRTLNVDKYAAGLFGLSVSADVLQVSVTGHGRLSDGRIDTTQLASAVFCTGEHCTTCPDGSQLPVPPAPLASPSLLAVTGGRAGATVSLAGISLEDACKPKPTPSGRVWVHIERPASRGMEAGRVLELVACDGKIGPWKGVMRLGGLDTGDGFKVPFADLPLAFTMKAEGTPVHTSVSGVVPTPVFKLKVGYELDVSVSGDSMSITGKGTGDTGLVALSTALPGLENLPIEPAPAGMCP